MSSLGFWPGDPWPHGATEAMFYAYTVPEPAGFPRPRPPRRGLLQPELKEFLLPYDDVRRAPDPGAAILEFAQSTYDAGANLAGWDRDALRYP